MRFLIPVILLAAAIGLFAVYTNPAYQNIKLVQVQVGAYSDALDKAKQLKEVRDQLLSRRNTFAPEDMQKLERILPNNVDNIRFVIDINNIAARHALSLSNVAVGTVSDSKSARSALSVGKSGDPVGSATVGFSLTADYDTFLQFLQDVEHSLRIVDVQSLDFKPTTNNTYTISLTIRTYWLH